MSLTTSEARLLYGILERFATPRPPEMYAPWMHVMEKLRKESETKEKTGHGTKEK